MTAYITAADVIAAIPGGAAPTADQVDYAAVVARLTSLCTTTAEMIDAELGFDFHRHPADPYNDDEVRILDGKGLGELHVHRGVVDLTTVEIRFGTGDWEPLEPEDWELTSMYENEGSRPYDHLRLTGVGRIRFPSGVRNVRLTGVFGWATPPARLTESNVAWVRQHLAAGDSWSGSVTVPEGAAIPGPRLVLPDDLRMFLTRESRRYAECWV